MSASINDRITDTRNAARPNSARVTTARITAATTLICDNLAGWPTASKVHFVTYTVDSNSRPVAGSQLDCYGIVSGNNITSFTVIDGTDTGNSINDYVEMLPTAAWGQDLATALTTEHNRSGTHKNITTNTITATSGTFTSLTIAGSATSEGWAPLGATPDTVTALGNRSYSLLFNSNDLTDTVSNGMRLRTTRTVAAPTQCADLESGSSQYYSKTTPAGMTFTDDWAVGRWIKLESYGAVCVIDSRYNNTSGWLFYINASGQAALQGNNASSANFRRVVSYQSVPLNKWVFVSAQMDMSAYTATTTTCYTMIDGLDVPAFLEQGGTNPTALIQAGDYQVGAASGASFFDGKLAMGGVFSAKVTQATFLTLMSQIWTGSETSLISAHSFNNSLVDLNTTNANNLTANGSAVATNADSPFGGQADGTISSTLDYAIITKTAFSTNTTVTVQVPEGCTIPTSGGVSAVSYSTQKVPYGMPADSGKWRITHPHRTSDPSTSNTTYGAFMAGGWQMVVPIGAWTVGVKTNGIFSSTTTTVNYGFSSTALTGLTISAYPDISFRSNASSAAAYTFAVDARAPVALTAAATYVMYTLGATTASNLDGTSATQETYAECALL